MKAFMTGDWHLGKRQFTREVGGRNQRELDIERAAAHAVDLAINYQPDLILIGGDTFDHVRPNFHAVVRSWQREIQRLSERTQAEIVIVLGNHEAGRTSESLSPVFVVESVPRVHIADKPTRFRLVLPRTREVVSVAAFPFNGLSEDGAYRLEPDPAADLNVALLHAAVRSSAAPGLLPAFYSGDNAIDIARAADAFHLIALGDFHTYTNLVPGRCVVYPGSIERVASSVWDEPEAKGVVTFDSVTQEQFFSEIPTRPVFDVENDVTDSESLNALLAFVSSAPMYADAIVRLRVDEFPRSERESVNWKLVREIKSKALHFHLDLRFAERAPHPLGDRRATRGITLSQSAAEFFREDAAEVRELALKYLDQAGAA